VADDSQVVRDEQQGEAAAAAQLSIVAPAMGRLRAWSIENFTYADVIGWHVENLTPLRRVKV